MCGPKPPIDAVPSEADVPNPRARASEAKKLQKLHPNANHSPVNSGKSRLLAGRSRGSPHLLARARREVVIEK